MSERAFGYFLVVQEGLASSLACRRVREKSSGVVRRRGPNSSIWQIDGNASQFSWLDALQPALGLVYKSRRLFLFFNIKLNYAFYSST